MFVVKDGNLTDVEGQFFWLGGKVLRQDASQSDQIHNQEIALSARMSFYLFTDGRVDQFGGPNDRKFNMPQLRELLLANSHLPMEEQKTAIDLAFNAWKGEQRQIDDVLVIGVKV